MERPSTALRTDVVLASRGSPPSNRTVPASKRGGSPSKATGQSSHRGQAAHRGQASQRGQSSQRSQTGGQRMGTGRRAQGDSHRKHRSSPNSKSPSALLSVPEGADETADEIVAIQPLPMSLFMPMTTSHLDDDAEIRGPRAARTGPRSSLASAGHVLDVRLRRQLEHRGTGAAESHRRVVSKAVAAAASSAPPPLIPVEGLEESRVDALAKLATLQTQLQTLDTNQPLERRLGESIVSRGYSVPSLLKEWDRNGDGSISLVEFRQVCTLPYRAVRSVSQPLFPSPTQAPPRYTATSHSADVARRLAGVGRCHAPSTRF